jgi:hypothetical protein
MRRFGSTIAVAILLGVGGCGSETKSAMPDVTGKKLNVAESVIEDAGFDDAIKVDGGGMLGIVDKSNWEVCSQQPKAGSSISGAPQLVVERSCDGGRVNEATPSTTLEPAADEPSDSAEGKTLTKGNSEELAALLKVSDYCDPSVAKFATKYDDRTIEFRGSISNMSNHGDADTRYDILVAPGNKGPNSAVGPAFKLEDVSVFDLKLTGDRIPDAVGEGDRFRFIARVEDYNADQCLFFLQPESTEAL